LFNHSLLTDSALKGGSNLNTEGGSLWIEEERLDC